MSEDNRSVVGNEWQSTKFKHPEIDATIRIRKAHPEPDLVDLSTLTEDADLVGIRCGVVCPMTGGLIGGKVIRNDGNRQFGWVSDNNKLACILAYDQQWKAWTASVFLNIGAIAKADFN